MKLICSNDQVISIFFDKNSLLDGKIKKIEIFNDKSGVRINLHFLMRKSSKYNNVVFSFCGCKNYGFYYEDVYEFYNVETIKFFKNSSGLYYVSLDPYNEEKSISDKDQDFILSKEVFAYEIDGGL